MEEKWGGRRKEKEIKGHLPYFSSVWKQPSYTACYKNYAVFRFLYLIFICPHFNFALTCYLNVRS